MLPILKVITSIKNWLYSKWTAHVVERYWEYSFNFARFRRNPRFWFKFWFKYDFPDIIKNRFRSRIIHITGYLVISSIIFSPIILILARDLDVYMKLCSILCRINEEFYDYTSLRFTVDVSVVEVLITVNKYLSKLNGFNTEFIQAVNCRDVDSMIRILLDTKAAYLNLLPFSGVGKWLGMLWEFRRFISNLLWHSWPLSPGPGFAVTKLAWSSWYDNYASTDMLYTVLYFRIFYDGALEVLESTTDWCNKFNGLFSGAEERASRKELRELEALGKPSLHEAGLKLWREEFDKL